ncbi:MAG: hypothetical protein HY521_14575 [Proteobacteria bacterium]|nr:hypothetical protein [Pseudomonadota bacterium]
MRYRKYGYPALAGLALALIWFAPAGAQQVACGEREQIAKALAQSYEEHPIARGLASGGVMIEVLAAESGSFTVLLTRPNGLSCLITAGEYWESVPARDPAALAGIGM